MPLIKVKALDYNCNYAYAPPQVETLINTDEIVSAMPTEARGIGPFIKVKFRDGSTMTVVATIEEILGD